MSLSPDLARDALLALERPLSQITERDPEQEVRGIALPVVDAVLVAGREHALKNDPVVAAIAGLITVDTVAEGDPVRAVDALIVVRQLREAIDRAWGPWTPSI
jgi:hypothetical protein